MKIVGNFLQECGGESLRRWPGKCGITVELVHWVAAERQDCNFLQGPGERDNKGLFGIGGFWMRFGVLCSSGAGAEIGYRPRRKAFSLSPGRNSCLTSRFSRELMLLCRPILGSRMIVHISDPIMLSSLALSVRQSRTSFMSNACLSNP